MLSIVSQIQQINLLGITMLALAFFQFQFSLMTGGQMDLQNTIAVIAFLNSIGIFAMLYKIGRYTGTMDTRLQNVESAVKDIWSVLRKLEEHGERIARLEAAKLAALAAKGDSGG